MNTIYPCPFVEFCICRTATCRVREPDEGCYLYRYFKDLIERREKENENLAHEIN